MGEARIDPDKPVNAADMFGEVPVRQAQQRSHAGSQKASHVFMSLVTVAFYTKRQRCWPIETKQFPM
eukprot:6232476-Amphidinium_carterae.1